MCACPLREEVAKLIRRDAGRVLHVRACLLLSSLACARARTHTHTHTHMLTVPCLPLTQVLGQTAAAVSSAAARPSSAHSTHAVAAAAACTAVQECARALIALPLVQDAVSLEDYCSSLLCAASAVELCGCAAAGPPAGTQPVAWAAAALQVMRTYLEAFSQSQRSQFGQRKVFSAVASRLLPCFVSCRRALLQQCMIGSHPGLLGGAKALCKLLDSVCFDVMFADEHAADYASACTAARLLAADEHARAVSAASGESFAAAGRHGKRARSRRGGPGAPALVVSYQRAVLDGWAALVRGSHSDAHADRSDRPQLLQWRAAAALEYVPVFYRQYVRVVGATDVAAATGPQTAAQQGGREEEGGGAGEGAAVAAETKRKRETSVASAVCSEYAALSPAMSLALDLLVLCGLPVSAVYSSTRQCPPMWPPPRRDACTRAAGLQAAAAVLRAVDQHAVYRANADTPNRAALHALRAHADAFTLVLAEVAVEVEQSCCAIAGRRLGEPARAQAMQELLDALEAVRACCACVQQCAALNHELVGHNIGRLVALLALSASAAGKALGVESGVLARSAREARLACVAALSDLVLLYGKLRELPAFCSAATEALVDHVWASVPGVVPEAAVIALLHAASPALCVAVKASPPALLPLLAQRLAETAAANAASPSEGTVVADGSHVAQVLLAWTLRSAEASTQHAVALLRALDPVAARLCPAEHTEAAGLQGHERGEPLPFRLTVHPSSWLLWTAACELRVRAAAILPAVRDRARPPAEGSHAERAVPDAKELLAAVADELCRVQRASATLVAAARHAQPAHVRALATVSLLLARPYARSGREPGGATGVAEATVPRDADRAGLHDGAAATAIQLALSLPAEPSFDGIARVVLQLVLAHQGTLPAPLVGCTRVRDYARRCRSPTRAGDERCAAGGRRSPWGASSHAPHADFSRSCT